MWHMLCAHCLEQAPRRVLGIQRPPQGSGLQVLLGSEPVARKRLSPARADAGQPVCRGLGCCVSKVLHTQTNSGRAVAVPGDRAGDRASTDHSPCEKPRASAPMPQWKVLCCSCCLLTRTAQSRQTPQQPRHSSQPTLPQPLLQATQVKLLRASVGKVADCVRTRRAKSGT